MIVWRGVKSSMLLGSLQWCWRDDFMEFIKARMRGAAPGYIFVK